MLSESLLVCDNEMNISLLSLICMPYKQGNETYRDGTQMIVACQFGPL